MPERHTVDFDRASLNLLSDPGKHTITLQFERSPGGRNRVSPTLGRNLNALQGRYGVGVISRLNRWRKGAPNPFVLPSRSKPHPENPDVLCFEIGVNQGETMDSALAQLLDFFRQQPGYLRTFGAPLDRDQVPVRGQRKADGNLSASAGNALRKMMEHPKGRT
jgi:hypothetical protein